MQSKRDIAAFVLIVLAVALIFTVLGRCWVRPAEDAAETEPPAIHPPVGEQGFASAEASYFLPAAARSNQETPVKGDRVLTRSVVRIPADGGNPLALRGSSSTESNRDPIREEETTEEPEAQYPSGGEEPALIPLGRYNIVGYDTCAACCGKTDGITKSGAAATVGRTCAVNGLPFGTVLYIDGIGERVVEDRGYLADGVIDVLCEDHAACYAITGVYDVYIVEAAG